MINTSLLTTDTSVELKPLHSPQSLQRIGFSEGSDFAQISKAEKEQRVRENLQKFRALKIFPIFNNYKINEFSVNYYLYFKFFETLIRMLLGMLFYVLLVDYIKNNFIAAIGLLFEDDQISHYISQAYIAITTLFGGAILRVLRSMELKRITHSENIQRLPWTECFFSLLLENIPQVWTYSDIVHAIQDGIKKSRVRGDVRGLIQIQDYHEFYRLKREAKNIEKKVQYSKNKTSPQAVLLEQKKTEIEEQLNRIKDSILDLRLYRHKAIVIFTTLEAKEAIRQLYSAKWWTFANYRTSSGMYATELPEPQDLIFENLCCSKSKMLLQKLAWYVIGMPLGIGFFFLLLSIESKEIECEQPKFLDSLISLLTIQVLYLIIEKFYEISHKYMHYISGFEAKTAHQYYMIYTKTTLYLGLQFKIVTEYPKCDIWPSHLAYTTFIFVVEILIVKLIHIASKKEFQLSKGITPVIPLMFFTFAFGFNFSLYVLWIILAALFLMVLIDKYRIVRYSEPSTRQSPDVLLHLLEAFKFDQLLYLYGGYLVLMYTLNKVIYLHDENSESTEVSTDPIAQAYLNNYNQIIILYFIIAGIFAFVLTVLPWIFNPDGMTRKIHNKFIHEHISQTYDSVLHKFPSTYRREDPYHQLMENDEADLLNLNCSNDTKAD